MTGDSFGCELDQFIDKKLNIFRANSSKAIFMNLIDKRVDYIMWGYFPLLAISSRINVKDKIKVLDNSVTVQQMYLGFSKKSYYKKYLPQINKILNRFQIDGTIKRLESKYYKIYESKCKCKMDCNCEMECK